MIRYVPVALAGFFISVHYGTILYLNSTLLGSFFQPSVVSILFVLGALGNLVLFLFSAKFVRKFGKRFLLSLSLILAAASTLTLATTDSPTLVLIGFLIHASFFFINYYCLDIYLEELSTDRRTGEIRGAYLTLISLGIALGPLLLSLLTSIIDELKPVYMVGAMLLIIPILLSVFNFKSETPHEHEPFHHSTRLPFKLWWQTVNVRRATLARTTLETFYAFMIIYTPVYLHQYLGFTWSELGVIFTVMLLPFILLEWPTGEVADRFFGEKEIMGIGFVFMISSLLVMPFIGKLFAVWMIILLLSRVGASLVEITTESYFFKQIDASDTALISIFRLARSVSIIFGSTLGALALSFLSIEKIFFIAAIVVFFGLRESMLIEDTL